MLGSCLGPELVSDGRSAVLSGPSGTGETHLFIAIAYRAIQHGYDARFVSADALIGHLSRTAIKGRLETALEPFLHPHVLVIDELGYLSHATDAANVRYRVVNERYLKRRPMLLTTSKRWGRSAMCSMMATWRRRSSSGSSSGARISRCVAARTAPDHLSEEESPPRRAKSA